MFGIGFLEICIILIFSLILFGPQKAPELMQKIGKFLFQMRKVGNEVKSSVEDAMAYEEKNDQQSLEKNFHEKFKDKERIKNLDAVAWEPKEN